MKAYANIKLTPGIGKARHVRVPMIETFRVEQSIDNDVDPFTIDIGDARSQLIEALDRDTEVKVDIFCPETQTGKVKQVFSGLVDVETFVTSKTHTMQGSDVPTAILLGTDALPGYWRRKNPSKLLAERCRALGLTRFKIAPMAEIGRLWSDASEKEWAFQYRVARMGGCFMWSDNTGTLVVDVLNYSKTSYSYSFGTPLRGEQSRGWIPVQDVTHTSNKQQRIDRAIVYGEDKKKKGFVPFSTANNPHSSSIQKWQRKPIAISVLTTARTQANLDKEAKEQIFESIVGAQEITITVDGRVHIQQNEMARVNLPEYGISGRFYVVGVAKNFSPDGLTQDVRLRERGFALDDRIPQAPALTKQPNTGTDVSTANIADYLANKDVRWAGSFARATREFLSGKTSDQGWDFSFALGVMLSICYVETGFENKPEIVTGHPEAEWFAKPTSLGDPVPTTDPFTGDPVDPAMFSGGANTLAQLQQEWMKIFANAKSNPLNPFYPSRERGVGPMQLTYLPSKEWADGFGWPSGAPSGTPEYAGGRWNPESNIRAAAKLLAACAKQVGADPQNSETIWAAVACYNDGTGTTQKGRNYAAKVRAAFNATYGAWAAAAVGTQQKESPGSALYQFRDGNGNVILTLSSNTPQTVAKAITWAMARRGDDYLYGGRGPLYDCSSFVNHAIIVGDPSLASEVGLTGNGADQHGYDTFTLRYHGKAVSKDSLLPGDLVFFNGTNSKGELEPWGHVGMFVGEGQFIQDPHTHDVVKLSGLGETYYRDNYLGARRFFFWATRGA